MNLKLISVFVCAVSSWDGGRSVLDTQSAKDFFHERKRHWSDDYEEELDHGKVRVISIVHFLFYNKRETQNNFTIAHHHDMTSDVKVLLKPQQTNKY